ncbi:MAG: polyphenol oxidase family protein [Treponema sp.]|nr:polyphenol oxidase family protein [Candidatus Treponema equifaecale]
MLNKISVKDHLKGKEESHYITLPFYLDSKPLENSPKWGMTLLTAGTMRFRWNETNQNREDQIKQILKELDKFTCSGSCVGEGHLCDCKKKFTSVELIHSKIVLEAKSAEDTLNQKADGIITRNRFLVPAVTVADCVPLFLYDTESGAVGAFHSGWKGTGIVGEGVKKMTELYGSKPEKICAAIGPHIGNCCYNVDEERKVYFTENFGPQCISKPSVIKDERFPYALSLTEANLIVLKNAGIPEENIVVATDCTCCTCFDSNSKKNVFGSFRRQAAFLPPELDADARSKSMTVQAAFVIY